MRDPFDDLRRYARDLESQVRSERARHRVQLALSPSPPPTPRRTAIVALGTALLLVVSNVALATTADPAVPGDALYGVDRAYERLSQTLGIPQDLLAERFDEAEVLFERGRASEALAVAREALAEIADAEDVEEARERLEALVERTGGPSESEVEGMLRSVQEGGDAVAEVAKTMAETGEVPPVAGSTPSGNPAPGLTDNPGDGPPPSTPGEGPPEDLPGGPDTAP